MRAARLRRSSDIEMLRAEGRSLRRPSFVARVRHTGGPVPRLGVTAPRTLGGSVARNRARRRVREAFRLAFADLASAPPVDFMISARKDAATTEFAALRGEAASVIAEAAR